MVAGVAMGMIYDEGTGKYEMLADIQAGDDFLGDMDFKVARSEKVSPHFRWTARSQDSLWG